MYCIYRIINKINGKTYIGQHKYKDLSIDGYMGSGKYLWNAYNKYGIENFEREILVSEIETREEINKLEKEYIRLERESGHSEYNISNGGEGWNLSGINHPLYGKHRSEEIKNKISIAMKGENNPLYGKHYSEGTRKKMSIAKRGENHPLYGKHRSEEIKNKISIAMKGENNPLYGKHRLLEIRRKISIAHKGKQFSEEHKKKLSEAKKAENNPLYGKHRSEEIKNKISIAMKGENHPLYGKHHSEETKRKMSESIRISRLGKKFYNKGIECHMYIPGTEPEGYILGKLSRDKEDKNDLVWKSVQI